MLASAFRFNARPFCTALYRCTRGYATKVDIKMLKKLRELNPVSMSKAKEALLSTDNDISKALEWLDKDALKSGAKKAEKVKGRVASEGVISVHIDNASTTGSIVELGCETDFVARNSIFVDLATEIATACTSFSNANVGNIILSQIETNKLAEKMLENRTIGETITETIGRIGENIVLRRAVVTGSQNSKDSIIVGGYVHGGIAGKNGNLAGKIGGIVSIKGSVKNQEQHGVLVQLARRLAQQVVGYAPRYMTMEEWDSAMSSEQPPSDEPDIAVLEKQQFLFGGGTVSEVLAKISEELGAPVSLKSFVRYERGEGIEKPTQLSFAEEVRQQLS